MGCVDIRESTGLIIFEATPEVEGSVETSLFTAIEFQIFNCYLGILNVFLEDSTRRHFLNITKGVIINPEGNIHPLSFEVFTCYLICILKFCS